MTFEDWHFEKKVKPRQDWKRVSQQAKERKILNKKSKRDIEREQRIKELGGDTIEVSYGEPLEEDIRKERIEYELDLKYPNRHKEKKEKVLKIPYARGKERTELQYKRDLLFGARSRAKAYGVDFNLELDDIIIPETCPILKMKLEWGDKLTKKTPTIDRIIPEKGYVKGNISVISHKANRLKNNATLWEMQQIVAYIKDRTGKS